nr:hypothetical protein 2 [bacterium]
MLSKVPDKYLAESKLSASDMQPGDVGWIRSNQLQVDRNGIMFLYGNVKVSSERQTGENQIDICGLTTSPADSTDVRIEVMPDKTYGVDLSLTNKKWTTIYHQYTAWNNTIPVTVLEQS